MHQNTCKQLGSCDTPLAHLAMLINTHEDWLIKRVLSYARAREYTRYTSTLEAAWRASVTGLSTAVIEAMGATQGPPELGPDDDYTSDPVASFGILEAQRHRNRGRKGCTAYRSA